MVSWRDDRGAEHHVAVRGGMLEVRGGDTIAIATPEAVAGDDLHRLETEVLAELSAPTARRSRRRAPMRSGSISPRSARSSAFCGPSAPPRAAGLARPGSQDGLEP